MPQDPGIGLAMPKPNGGAGPPREVDTAAAAPQPKPQPKPSQERKSSLPRFDENPIGAIGVVLSQVAAGMRGTEGPVEKAQAQALQDQALRLRTAAVMFDAIKAGSAMLDQAPAGQRDKVISQLEATVQLPGLGDMLRALGGSGKKDAVIGFLDEHPNMLPGIADLVQSGVLDADGAVKMVTDLLAKQAEARAGIAAEVAKEEATREGKVKTAGEIAKAKEAAKAEKATKSVRIVRGGTPEAAEMNLPDEGTFEVKMTGDEVTDVNTLTTKGTTINVDLSKEAEKMALQLSESADGLAQQVRQLENFKALARETDTNALVPVTKPIQEMLSAAGVNIGDARQIALRQVFESMQNVNALWFRNPESGFGLTGNTSDRDVKFLQSIGGRLSNTPEANEAILTILIARQRRKADIDQAKSDYLLENGSLKGWSKVRGKIIDAELFTPGEKEALEGLAAKAEKTGAADLEGLSDDDLIGLPAESIADPDAYEQELKKRKLIQ